MAKEEKSKKEQEIEIVENDIKNLVDKNPQLLQKVISDLQKDPKYNLAIKQTMVHSGPLPDPLTLKEYGQIYKNAPKDIIDMAKKEQNFRHSSTYFGQFSALLIGIGGLGVTAYLGINGQPELAGLIGFGSLGSLVGTFLYRKK